jgi:hypothetical protein
MAYKQDKLAALSSDIVRLSNKLKAAAGYYIAESFQKKRPAAKLACKALKEISACTAAELAIFSADLVCLLNKLKAANRNKAAGSTFRIRVCVSDKAQSHITEPIPPSTSEQGTFTASATAPNGNGQPTTHDAGRVPEDSLNPSTERTLALYLAQCDRFFQHSDTQLSLLTISTVDELAIPEASDSGTEAEIEQTLAREDEQQATAIREQKTSDITQWIAQHQASKTQNKAQQLHDKYLALCREAEARATSTPAHLNTKAEAYFAEHLGETAVAILADAHYDAVYWKHFRKRTA